MLPVGHTGEVQVFHREGQRQTLAHIRKYAGFWSWPEKRRRELGIVKDLLCAMSLRGVRLYHSPESASNDPPDCILHATDGALVAAEVTELVCKEATIRNQKGERVYRDWQPIEVFREVSSLLL